MEESGKIEALSMDGSPIEIGSVVRYLNTGTVGRVLDLKEDEDGIWVLVDSTGLFYKPETLVIANENDLKGEMKERTSVDETKSYMHRKAEGEADYDLEDVGQVTGGG